MAKTISVLVLPEPSEQGPGTLIFQRIYPEKQDVVHFESEDGEVLLICTASLDVLDPSGTLVGRIGTCESNAALTDATLVFKPTAAYAKVGLTALEAKVRHAEVFLEFDRQLFTHYTTWAASTWQR